MSHPKCQRHRHRQKNRRDARHQGQVRCPSLDDSAQSAARTHEHSIEVLRGKPELLAQNLFVSSI